MREWEIGAVENIHGALPYIRFAPILALVGVGVNRIGKEETNALMYHFLNGITPATERFTYHFWSSPRNFGHDEEVSEQLQEANTHLLSQDIAILEGQQAMIDGLGGDPDMVNIPVDAGPLSARRIVASLLAEEAS